MSRGQIAAISAYLLSSIGEPALQQELSRQLVDGTLSRDDLAWVFEANRREKKGGDRAIVRAVALIDDELSLTVAGPDLDLEGCSDRRVAQREIEPASERAASYARFSSDLQRAESNADQQRTCREAAERNHHVITDDREFAGAGVSGTRRQRVGLLAALAAAERGEFSILYLYSLICAGSFDRSPFDIAGSPLAMCLLNKFYLAVKICMCALHLEMETLFARCNRFRGLIVDVDRQTGLILNGP